MRARFAILVLALAGGLFAQPPSAQSVLGTVTAMHPDSAAIEIKPETGSPVDVKVNGSTITKKVAPGQTDLGKAESIGVTDIAVGDRVLVTLAAGSNEARRIIVIPSGDLAKRDSDDRLDWQKRGVAGLVTAVAGNDITVELRSLSGTTKYTVTAGPKTTFMRYAPDSVKYSDAAKSALNEIAVGDQLRARGAKSADGTKIDAENIVFGTFLSRAGTITAVNPETREITIKDLASNKPLVVKFVPDSQVKRMPDVAAAQGMMATAQGPGRGPAAGPSKGPDLAQMLEKLPPIKLDDLKPKEVIVVSAIRGAKPDQITAIVFLANAETLVQLAMAARGAAGPAPSLAGLAGSISNVGP